MLCSMTPIISFCILTLFICFCQVEAKAIKFTSMLSVAVKASPNSMAKYVPNLTKILLHLMHSPLAAPYAVPLFIQLKDSVFHGELKHLDKFC